MLKIYHNTRCGKSRCALQLIEKSVQAFEVMEYLKSPPIVVLNRKAWVARDDESLQEIETAIRV